MLSLLIKNSFVEMKLISYACPEPVVKINVNSLISKVSNSY